MMWLIGALGWLRKAFSALLGLVTRWPLPCALAASLCLSAWLLLVTVPSLKSDNRALATRIIQQKAEFEEAQDKAKAEQLALRAKEQADFTRIAEGNRHDEDVRHSAILAAAERVRRERVCSRPASAKREGGPSPDDNGPGSGPELVAITRQEFDDFVSVTERLELVHDFGNRLLDAGLAVKAEPLPEVNY